MYKHSLSIELTAGASFIKMLASHCMDLDQDTDSAHHLYIFESPAEVDRLEKLLIQSEVEYERIELIEIPQHSRRTELFEDLGFTSQQHRCYLYHELVFLFTLRVASESETKAEIDQAELQLEEFLIAHFETDKQTVYIVEKHHDDLMFGIAKAYHCKVFSYPKLDL